MTDRLDHLARLAGIELDADERDRIKRQLDALQSLIDALPDEVEDVGNPHAVRLPLRADVPEDPLPVEAVEALMPRSRDGWLDLPPVRDRES